MLLGAEARQFRNGPAFFIAKQVVILVDNHVDHRLDTLPLFVRQIEMSHHVVSLLFFTRGSMTVFKRLMTHYLNRPWKRPSRRHVIEVVIGSGAGAR